MGAGKLIFVHYIPPEEPAHEGIETNVCLMFSNIIVIKLSLPVFEGKSPRTTVRKFFYLF